MDTHVLYLLGLLSTVMHVLGLLHALHALGHTRTAQGTIAWIISLVAFPYVAVPLYWFLGRSHFTGYVEARRAGRQRIHRVARDVLEALRPYATAFAPPHGDIARVAAPLGGLPATRGNALELLVDGEATFGALLSAIAEAREYVAMEFFIVHGDAIGEEVKTALAAAARRGVRVFFLYDALGSIGLPSRYAADLERAGVEVAAFRSAKGWRQRFQINFRNHRKITVVDGRVAFIGGINVGDEYLGRSRRFGHWRDTHLRMRGPSVSCAQLAFLEDWHWATDRVPDLAWNPEPPGPGGQAVFVLPTGPADDLEACRLSLVNTINGATERLWITSPYFVPDPAVALALQLAALRGVDVRVMLPDRPDHLLVYLSSFSYCAEMPRYGVRIFRYTGGFLHQKVMLVDRDLAGVGSANLDNRSVFLNFEITVLCQDPGFAAAVEAMLEKDFAACREVAPGEFGKRPAGFRLAVRMARLLAPVQ